MKKIANALKDIMKTKTALIALNVLFLGVKFVILQAKFAYRVSMKNCFLLYVKKKKKDSLSKLSPNLMDKVVR